MHSLAVGCALYPAPGTCDANSSVPITSKFCTLSPRPAQDPDNSFYFVVDMVNEQDLGIQIKAIANPN